MILQDAGRRSRFAVPLIFLALAGIGTAALAPDENPVQQHLLQPDFPSEATDTRALQSLRDALSVLQTHYFSLWLGKWTTAIDWTAAVTSTHLAATLTTLSHSLSYTLPAPAHTPIEAQLVEIEINKYFGHLIAYYFGQDYFSLRMQAYDDMLWVVLGWLETITLVKGHSERHYDGERGEWHAKQFVPAFAHRARVFYDLASEGWDWRLCGGGMTWNPRLLPYKNAITNQLFVAASVGMYLSFPGDENCSPFMLHLDGIAKEQANTFACADQENEPEYDPIYLANAINAYEWLAHSGMLNAQGLYTDGFHISGYAHNHSRTTCDDRNEMVYTYNQGVILSGLRGLWEATGNTSYLDDAHALVRNVIRATGWSLPHPTPTSTSTWSGLGSAGILADLCDPLATCSQDAQSFKAIFFHHLTAFCAPLPTSPARHHKTHAAGPDLYIAYRNACNAYTDWVSHNAQAALRTRDREGRFGMWWGARLADEVVLPRGALDYRNDPVLLGTWGLPEERVEKGGFRDDGDGDPNERGRGRTVETQGGGVAVVRAMWEFGRWREGWNEGGAVREV